MAGQRCSTMKRPRAEEGDGGESHHQYKHLKGAQLPAKIQAMPHIMARIDEFAMPTEAAALQAAAANEIDWLRKLLPHLRHKMADVARAIIKIAATHGFWEVFNLVDTWWAPEDEEGREEKFRTGCGDSLTKAIEGGHNAILFDLLTRYSCDYFAGLDLALKLGDDHAATTIYQLVGNMEGHLRWAARHGSLRVLKDVYDACWEESLPEAMGIAACHGHFEIVEFLFEKCRLQLLEVEKDRDVYKRPLACAIMHGQVEIAKYLYANGGYADYSLDELKVVVAARGPLELVELFHKDGLYDASSLCEAFELAAGGGKIDIMVFLQAHGGCTITSFEKAFMNAAINGKIDAMEYLYSLDEFKMSAAFTNQVFVAAARAGCLDSVKFLDGKKPLTHDIIIEAFESAASNTTMGAVVGGRVDVMEFLYGNGCITPETITRIFLSAVSTTCVDVIKYLYAKAPLSPPVIDEAFERAAFQHSASVLKFLLQTGAVSPTAVQKCFLNAVHYGRIYDVEFLLECECISQNLLEQAFARKRVSGRMEVLLRHYLEKQ